MKHLALLFSILISHQIFAKSTYTIHYLGDANPITIEVPTTIFNKDNSEQMMGTKKITFNFEKESTLGLNADLSVEVDGQKIQFHGTSLSKSIINITQQNIDSKNLVANVSFLPSEELMAPTNGGVTEPEFKNGIISFVAGKLTNPKLFTLNAFLKRKRFLASPEILINRNLTESDYTIEAITENRYRVSIDLVKITDGKFNLSKNNILKLKLSINYDFKNTINLDEVGEPSIEKETKIRIINK